MADQSPDGCRTLSGSLSSWVLLGHVEIQIRAVISIGPRRVPGFSTIRA